MAKVQISLSSNMNVSVPYSNGKNDKGKTAVITKEDFLKSAKPKIVTIDGVVVGTLMPKVFSTGGFGYGMNGKIVDTLEVA